MCAQSRAENSRVQSVCKAAEKSSEQSGGGERGRMKKNLIVGPHDLGVPLPCGVSERPRHDLLPRALLLDAGVWGRGAAKGG